MTTHETNAETFADSKTQSPFQKFRASITDPVVDLRFFNDAIRTALTLGTAGAIGGYLLDNSPNKLGMFSGGVLLICALILLLINVYQLFYAALKLFDVPSKGKPTTVKNGLN